MVRATMSELETNPRKFASIAMDQDVLITENGRPVIKLVSAKRDKKAALANLQHLFQGAQISDGDVQKAREILS